MIFGVPQYIDVEDKIAGPLTVRQFLWMLGYGGFLIVLWGIFEIGAFLILAALLGIIFGALAFYRPHGVHLITFVGYGIGYVLRPKVYIWKRLVEDENKKKSSKKKYESHFYKSKSKMNQRDMHALSEALDTEGAKSSDRFMEIIAPVNNKK